ncbi:MAG TPA: sialidase family protein [Polyangia bacterium]|nr:sialidase family protein [Polyangia bacterium]
MPPLTCSAKILGAGAAVAVMLAAASAHANGAFPGGAEILAPADRPQRIVLGTNFGLVLSDDGGAHWRWTCEHDASAGALRYGVARGDSRRILALTSNTLVVTEDGGCGWTRVATKPENVLIDYFIDTADPLRVLGLLESVETRQFFVGSLDLRQLGTPAQGLYTAPVEDTLTTIEVARSQPRVVYATQNPRVGPERTHLVRSDDGGQTWAMITPQGAPEYADLRIAAIDPTSAQKLYFRASRPREQGEGLLVSEDGGATVRAAFFTMGALSALLVLESGEVLLAEGDGTISHLHRSDDGGATFRQLPAVTIQARSLAERDGLVYAATNHTTDGYAIGVSRDRGATWQGLMSFDAVGAIDGCGDLPALCREVCTRLVAGRIFSEGTCLAGPAPADAGPSADGPAEPTKPPAGCGCRLAGRWGGQGAVALLVVALIAAAGARRARGERPRSGSVAPSRGG